MEKKKKNDSVKDKKVLEEVEIQDPEEIEEVTKPAKLIRIATMLKTMLTEVREAKLDEPGRKHLAAIHEQSIKELTEILSPELKKELKDVVLPFQANETPTQSELKVAQAQLVGWLEGLFHGIQATLFTQHVAAQPMIEEMRKQSLPQGDAPTEGDGTTGAYL
jgi:hypothetical protein